MRGAALRSYGFDPLGLLDPKNSGGFINPDWLRYSEVRQPAWGMAIQEECCVAQCSKCAAATVIEQAATELMELHLPGS